MRFLATLQRSQAEVRRRHRVRLAKGKEAKELDRLRRLLGKMKPNNTLMFMAQKMARS
jgi:hypothetical protein